MIVTEPTVVSAGTRLSPLLVILPLFTTRLKGGLVTPVSGYFATSKETEVATCPLMERSTL
jgi:hypothetical protein